MDIHCNSLRRATKYMSRWESYHNDRAYVTIRKILYTQANISQANKLRIFAKLGRRKHDYDIFPYHFDPRTVQIYWQKG